MKQVHRKYRGINPPPHGGTPGSDLLMDFSISVNPFPLPDSVITAYHEAVHNISTYPDTDNKELTNAFAGVSGIPAEKLLMTNGSAEAFSITAAALLEPGGKVMICEPCYSDYEHLSLLAGAEIVKIRAEESGRFIIDPNAVSTAVAKHKPDLIWLCSPNNPTGSVVPGRLIDSLCIQAEAYGGYVVLDEAYAAFLSDGYPVYKSGGFGNHENLIVIRSMTKDFGIPGLRLGSIIAEPELVRVFKLFKPYWSVGSPAQATGKAVLRELSYFSDSWRKTRELQLDLIQGLRTAGLDPALTADNKCGIFIFFKSPALREGRLFHEELENLGIRIRDCTSMGAAGFCRTGVKLKKENMKLIEATGRLLKEYGAGNE